MIRSTSIIIKHNSKSTKTKIYFATGVKPIYLLLDVCKKLDLVNKISPHVNIVANNKIDDIATDHSTGPDHLPYSANMDNTQNLEKWFLNKSSSTTSNTSKYPLPLM